MSDEPRLWTPKGWHAFEDDVHELLHLYERMAKRVDLDELVEQVLVSGAAQMTAAVDRDHRPQAFRLLVDGVEFLLSVEARSLSKHATDHPELRHCPAQLDHGLRWILRRQQRDAFEARAHLHVLLGEEIVVGARAGNGEVRFAQES